MHRLQKRRQLHNFTILNTYMENLPALRHTRALKNKWLNSQTLPDLLRILKVTQKKWDKAMQQPVYQRFTIPKKNGSPRIIENPNPVLKEIQRAINHHLQAVYYFAKHPASYGFCMAVKGDGNPCNIYTHALRHTGCRHLLNIDLKDFFHTVSAARIDEMFANSPFGHPDACRQWLVTATTLHGRLPMGAPTSPVISNLAATGFDAAMEALAKPHLLTYTRFVDDLSFSGANMPSGFVEMALQTIYEHGFEPNMKKVKLYGPTDTKLVTGLEVGHKVSLGKAYWAKTNMLLGQYTSLLCLLQNRPTDSLYSQMDEVRQKLNGFLAFARMIGPAETGRAEEIQWKIDNMEDTLEEFESLGWDEIPYHF